MQSCVLRARRVHGASEGKSHPAPLRKGLTTDRFLMSLEKPLGIITSKLQMGKLRHTQADPVHGKLAAELRSALLMPLAVL